MAHLLSASQEVEAASLQTLERAKQLNPADAENYYISARTLLAQGEPAKAAEGLQTAIKLKPNDYLLWLWLGYAHSAQNDFAGALDAYKESVKLAPFYAQPRWYLGDDLVRLERRDEGFAELSCAALSDPTLLHDMLDLAWDEYAGNTSEIVQAIKPQTPLMRLAVAQLFIAHGQVSEAVALCREPSNLTAGDRSILIAELLKAKQFPAAYDVWLGGLDADQHGSAHAGRVNDGDFERVLGTSGASFEWAMVSDKRPLRADLDTEEPYSGAHSLRLDWLGDTEIGSPVVTQLVLVEKNRPYRLSFAARGRDIVTGGPVVVSVLDAGQESGNVLGQSTPLPSNTTQWQNYNVMFTTGEMTSAVQIVVNRLPCSTTPCPIFGSSWFDEFSLQLSS